MRLDALLDAVDPAAGIESIEVGDTEITSVEHDSRAVEHGSLFCAIVGSAFDGHRFVPRAVEAGASVVLAQTGANVPALGDVVVLRAPDTRIAMAHLAAAFAGHPSEAIDVVGVTGTNGKTTTVHLLAAIGVAGGRTVRTLGTLTGVRTTPEATDIQPQLASWVAEGVDLVVMEVSSHALDQHRVDGMHFRAAGFTNLTDDHLDYHRTREEYFAAKARLFTPELTEQGIAVADLAHGQLLVDGADIPMTGIHPERQPVVSSTLGELQFVWRERAVRLPFGGRFNMANATLAAELALVVGLTPDDVVAGLAAAEPVPGRFEPISAGQPFAVIVDYAHTPDGLERLLASVTDETPDGRVIVVFGCGGDRDTAKRPSMGAAAEKGADVVIVTSDNPRSEDPDAIISDVLTGVGGPVQVEPDRRRAIGAALEIARPGDAVVIAGKGHEATQTIGDQVLDFDDRVVARALLAAAP
ncbi:MAG: UDP-N-acetylmuramoyl-L-alanyl-D-glutamate--2,6-diaminopimelate ligase [Acidimicrobiia bacterium]|nr:UDP-N-acetylmuramoyl-L-alanyl-D-glutamate--2,6-diaminopimelate ligase [Acidimicrobiia bacterium]